MKVVDLLREYSENPYNERLYKNLIDFFQRLTQDKSKHQFLSHAKQYAGMMIIMLSHWPIIVDYVERNKDKFSDEEKDNLIILNNILNKLTTEHFPEIKDFTFSRPVIKF